jgi:four helix bundle protein
MKVLSYKDLKVWQKSFELAVTIYKVTKRFPKEELYGLTSQIRRSAFSIPANIAEGYARRHLNEYLQFLRIAYSSGAELETHLLIVHRVGLMKDGDFQSLTELLTEVMKMLNGLMKKLKTSQKSS